MTTYAMDSQGKFIPATQRPDGTWRKPRRVRDGYVPQEEVPLYESKGKLFAQKPTLPPGLPPEMAQKAKEKREKEQRIKQQREAAEANRRSAHNPVPGLLILHDDKNQQRAKPVNSKPKKKAAELPDVLLEQKQKEEQKSTRQQSQEQKNSKIMQQQKRVEEITKEVDDFHLGASSSEDHVELSKKLRKLRKKIREIDAIEERLRSSEASRLDKDQIEKAKRKPEILKEIEELEKILPK
ncbi:partner of Y14 and mago [Toxorhynchites rutilus septentrionalis]|uniref:partner of Y14 and mago n=1 Tax=Toxorhynchites rutilus septentrionalis TaxID=329112 RepID=UPI002478CB29|nr:partner of Y14 and mago [Toxorhynchites rutilus septentrionalis]